MRLMDPIISFKPEAGKLYPYKSNFLYPVNWIRTR